MKKEEVRDIYLSLKRGRVLRGCIEFTFKNHNKRLLDDKWDCTLYCNGKSCAFISYEPPFGECFMDVRDGYAIKLLVKFLAMLYAQEVNLPAGCNLFKHNTPVVAMLLQNGYLRKLPDDDGVVFNPRVVNNFQELYKIAQIFGYAIQPQSEIIEYSKEYKDMLEFKIDCGHEIPQQHIVFAIKRGGYFGV